MQPYATEEQLKLYAFQMGKADGIRHEEVLPRASEIIDLNCGLGRGFFAPAGRTLTTKSFCTSTSKRLRLAPYIPESIDYAEYSTIDALTPSFSEIVDSNETPWLIANSGECWIPDEIVEISALWGWRETPSEIVEATLELAIAIWRGRDTAYARVVADVNGGGNTVFGALPDRVKLICEKWRRRREVVFA